MYCLVFPFSIAYSLLPEIKQLPFALCKINRVSLCESKATRKTIFSILGSSVELQRHCTAGFYRSKSQVWRDKSSQEERGKLGEKGETIPNKPIVCDLSKKSEDVLEQNWSGLREQTKLLEVDSKCGWQFIQSHLTFTSTLKSKYYYLNFTG